MEMQGEIQLMKLKKRRAFQRLHKGLLFGDIGLYFPSGSANTEESLKVLCVRFGSI